ncbi:carboxypeptidase regulatory-like domain-containing protein [Halothermothrix orenii]|uniref:Cna B domain protein n=1 Tax=Halothermothrix orenii (strain H 168 / OCM 544 / DSM 9562) TaxID=373903 RepID=B8D1V4_HALOH|nr:carboxypeptidase regulatory-like domain-containing protein [Halothermothrix orenii]ACL69181.1 Cna B domain protein [Halothermothrix orenii H 168]
MKKLSILAILLVGLLVLAGCSKDANDVNSAVKHTLTVTVTDEATQAAIEGATVTVDEASKTTDANGVAQFELTDGTYDITVTAEGYESKSGSVTIDGKDSTLDVTLTAGTGGSTDFVLITSNSGEETDIYVDWDYDNNIGNIAADAWGSGTTITQDSSYNNTPCWELTTGDGWGTVLAFMGDIYNVDQIAEFPVDLTADSVISFSVATTGDYDELRVKVVGEENEKEIAIDSFDNTSTDWQTVQVTTDQFSEVVPANVTQIAIIAFGGTAGTSKVYVTDYTISNAEVVIPKPQPETYTLTVTVTDDSQVAIEGATVTVNGTSKTTDASGVATFDLPDGTYTVNVSADGYANGSGSVTIDGADKSVDVSLTSLEVTSTLTVNVKNAVSGAVIEGAAVTVDGTEIVTDANGVAQFDLVDGDYTINVSANGYNTVSQDVTIAGADKTVDISLTTDAPSLFNSSFTVFNEAPITALQASYEVSTTEITEGDSSIKVTYPGDNWGGIYVEISTPVDLSSYDGGNLVFDIKLPTTIKDIGVKLEGPKGTGVQVQLANYTGTDAGNGWMTYTIPLSDLGIDLTQVAVGFGLWNPTDGTALDAWAGGDVYIDNVRFE